MALSLHKRQGKDDDESGIGVGSDVGDGIGTDKKKSGGRYKVSYKASGLNEESFDRLKA